MGRFVSRQVSTVPLLAREVALLRAVFTRVRPDVVHINNGGYPGALSARAAVLAARLAGVPAVLMSINNFAEGYGTAGRVMEYPLDRAVAAATDLFIAGSRSSVARLQEVLRLDDERARVVPNGADLRAPSESLAETRARLGLDGFRGTTFGIVALMEPRKGHRVLFDAFARLVRERALGPDATQLVVLGDGVLRAQLERQVAELGLGAHVCFLGHEANAMNVMGALDVLVLPSIANEDFPNVVLEAMGAGKAVIASRLAGTPEQVAEGETGLLVPPGDAEALAEALGALHADPARRAQMGAAGRRRYEAHFTAPAAVRRYAAVYRDLLTAR